MKKIKVRVVKEDTGYSATAIVKDNFIATEAENFKDLQEYFLDAINFTFADKGLNFSLSQIQFEYDLESFFAFYKVINAKALSERIGMNQSLLAQYIKGIKKPSAAQTNRILKGVQDIGRELADVQFLV